MGKKRGSQAIARAKKRIHLDNYIIANDEIGNKFADALSAKASEGVKVRVLHDRLGCMDVPRHTSAKAGGEPRRQLSADPREARDATRGLRRN